MKIKRFYLIENIFYMNLLNPMVYIVLILLILNFIFLSWWSVKREGKYNIYYIDKSHFKRDYVNIIIWIMDFSINTIWVNTKLTRAYTEYIKDKYFPYYPIGDWRRENAIKNSYQYYLNVKNDFWGGK